MTKHILRRVCETVILGYLVLFIWLFTIDAQSLYKVLGLSSSHSSQARERDIYTEFSLNGPTPGADKSPRSLLIVCTSASTLWRRMPILVNTLILSGHVTDYVIYSDLEESISGIPVIDAFSLLPRNLGQSEELENSRLQERHRREHPYKYLESNGLSGDCSGASGTSTLDKFNLLTILHQAFIQHPNFDWFVVIDDDTFVLWEGLQQFLATLSSETVHCLGHPAYRLGQIFPHGGSGVVMSSAAIHRLFANKESVAEQFQNATHQHHLGAHGLGVALTERGIIVNGDGQDHWNFVPDAPWNLRFNGENINETIFTLHDLHIRGFSLLAELRDSHNDPVPITYRTVLSNLILPYLSDRRESWDNHAQEKQSMSMAQDPILNDRAALSEEECRKSCEAWPECLMWKFDEPSACFRDSSVKLGEERVEEGESHMTSGWIVDRIRSNFGLPGETF